MTSRPDHGPDRRPSIILDCDPGVDDTLAILTAARYGDLLGITTVNGNVSVDHTTRNALAVAQIAELDVPVHRGADRPLVAPVHGATRVHGATGFGKVAHPELHRSETSDDAVGYLLDMSRSRDDIDLIAVGPLTNVALAIRHDPGFVSRLRSLTIMGGAANGLGNVTAVAEFNIWADPESAAIVFDAGDHTDVDPPQSYPPGHGRPIDDRRSCSTPRRPRPRSSPTCWITRSASPSTAARRCTIRARCWRSPIASSSACDRATSTSS